MIFFVDKKYFERDFSDFKVEFFHENISHFMKLCFIKVSFVATLIYELLRKQYNIMSYQQKQQNSNNKEFF